jgi:hypothetical protein
VNPGELEDEEAVLVLADGSKVVAHIGLTNNIAGITRVLVIRVRLLYLTVVFRTLMVIFMVMIITMAVAVAVAPAISSLLEGKIARLSDRASHGHLRSKRKEGSKHIDVRLHCGN